MTIEFAGKYGLPGSRRRFFYVARYLAAQDVKSKFRRSVLGSLWIVINQLAYSFGVGFIWARIFGLEMREFVPFLAVSFSMWSFLAASFSEGCMTFVNSFSYIKQIKTPLDVFVVRTVLGQSAYALTGFLTAILVGAIYDIKAVIGILYAAPGMVLVVAFAVFATRTMAFLGVRYRDLPHVVANVFQLLFVVTPVIYPPAVLDERGLGAYVKINPLSSLLDVVRAPAVDQRFAGIDSYLICIAACAFFAVFGALLQRRWTRHVAYWL